MSNTPNLEMPLLATGQAQKETTHNQALVILDAIHGGVVSRTETTPPAATSSGNAYIVASGATGVWSGHDDEIAYDFGSVWNFIDPTAGQGLPVYVQDDEEYVRWNGSAWEVVGFAGGVDASSTPYTPAEPADWGSPTPDDVAQALDILANYFSSATDAADVTYAPAVLADWDGSADPGNTNNALDQLAERVKDLEGVSSAGRHAIWIAAGSITPSATGGCAALATIASAANQPDIQTLDFDTSTQEYAQFSVRMPKSWDEGTVTFVPVWSHASTTTNFGVVWDLQAIALSNDDAIAQNFGTAQTSTDTGGTTNDIYIGPESSAITIAGTPAAEDMVFFRISRVTGNGSDTMAIDARLHGITLYITTDAETDA